MTHPPNVAPRPALRQQNGFSLIELLVSLAILMIVAGTGMSGLMRLTKTSQTISNRTEMHAGVRNATELLQQEVGQAGRVTLPVGITLAASLSSSTFTATSTMGMYAGEQLVVGTGTNEETVTLSAVDNSLHQITATFLNTHTVGEPISVYGGFAQGVVPTTTTNGSTGSVLKIFGDINDNGQMVYVEYSCDYTTGNLYRLSMAYDAGSKPAVTADRSLLNNIVANPDGTPCFTYQQNTANGMTFVVNVAITLTVETPDKDSVTGLKQRETKALLNVSPRNVFNVWQLAGLGIGNRVQPTPASVTALLPGP